MSLQLAKTGSNFIAHDIDLSVAKSMDTIMLSLVKYSSQKIQNDRVLVWRTTTIIRCCMHSCQRKSKVMCWFTRIYNAKLPTTTMTKAFRFAVYCRGLYKVMMEWPIISLSFSHTFVLYEITGVISWNDMIWSDYIFAKTANYIVS